MAPFIKPPATSQLPQPVKHRLLHSTPAAHITAYTPSLLIQGGFDTSHQAACHQPAAATYSAAKAAHTPHRITHQCTISQQTHPNQFRDAALSLLPLVVRSYCFASFLPLPLSQPPLFLPSAAFSASSAADSAWHASNNQLQLQYSQSCSLIVQAPLAPELSAMAHRTELKRI